MIDQIINGEVACAGVPGHKWIAIQRESRLRRRQHAGQLLTFFVEHLLRFLRDNGVSRGLQARSCTPAALQCRIVRITEYFVQGFPKINAWTSELSRQIGET